MHLEEQNSQWNGYFFKVKYAAVILHDGMNPTELIDLQHRYFLKT